MMKKVLHEGFTLIELSLSLVFVGILSVTVVLIINNTVGAYRRGMILNQINTTGMDIVDDMRSAVQNSSSDAVSSACITYYANDSETRAECLNDGAYNFVSITRTASVRISDGGEEDEILSDIPVYGAFCTGTYSYIWNSGYFMNNDTGDNTEREVLGGANPAIFRYRDAFNEVKTIEYSLRDIDGNQPFRLLKIRDDTRAVCVSVVRKYSDGRYDNNYTLPSNEDISNVFDISEGYGLVTEEPVDLILSDQDNDLVLYDLAVPRPAESTTQENMFYSASFILGTIRGGINIQSKGQSCDPPSDYATEEFDYCAINKFNFAVQANGD